MWVGFFALTRFRLLVGMRGFRLIYIPKRGTGFSPWVDREDG